MEFIHYYYPCLLKTKQKLKHCAHKVYASSNSVYIPLDQMTVKILQIR